MDEIVRLANEARGLEEDLDGWKNHERNAARFHAARVTISYTLKSDGGDAGRKGSVTVELTGEEVSGVVSRRVADAQARYDSAAASFEAEKAKYKRIED